MGRTLSIPTTANKEGHGNAKLENQLDEWNRIETFLSDNL